jgi:hypothetical protein
MRVLDILLEASIFSRANTYSFGHKVKLSSESSKGKIALEKILDAIPDFKPNEELEWVEKAPAKAPRILLGSSSGNERYFKRANGEIFALVGADSSIESVLNHANKYNRGDIAEAILGAAISAKLIKRGSDRIGEISADDIRNILKTALKKTNKLLIFTVVDKNSQIADKITYSLRLPSGSMDAIRNVKNWPKWEDLFQGAMSYANSADADRYSNYFYKNGKVDEVIITSDGVSGQKDRKTDIVAKVKDPTSPSGYRDLKNAAISLKADSSKYGQSTAGGLKQSKEQWLEAAKRLFEPFGITIDMPARNTKDILNFYIGIYKQAADKLNSALAGSSANKETTFVEKVADVIHSHGAGNVPNLRLVNLEKGGYSLHSFAILKKRLIDNNIDLAAKFAVGPRSGKPIIYIYDKNSKSVLTAIRFYLTEKASTSYFEKGDLLHDLTKIEKVKAPVPQPAPIAPQPVPPQPVPPAPVAQPTPVTKPSIPVPDENI